MAKKKEAVENTEEVKESVYWQWKKGENTGNVITIKDIDDKWINFNEGGRLAKDLKDEFIQPLEEDLAKELVKTQKPNTLDQPSQPSPAQQVQKTTDNVSPIRILLDKQKKLDKVPMGLSFSVKLPKKNIFEVLESSFDPSELNKELELFIEDQLDKEEILRTLKDSIKILIQERYK
tara:strand:+ start:40 stop:570 length:531 start_codon:yes stop_codon:yes gene_type:complete